MSWAEAYDFVKMPRRSSSLLCWSSAGAMGCVCSERNARERVRRYCFRMRGGGFEVRAVRRVGEQTSASGGAVRSAA